MPTPKGTTKGFVHACKCPHCGHEDDFRPLHELGLMVSGDFVSCDHCERRSQVLVFLPMVVVSLAREGRPVTAGPISAVPCPACMKKDDYGELMAQHLLERGATTSCDHCDQRSKVKSVTHTIRLVLQAA